MDSQVPHQDKYRLALNKSQQQKPSPRQGIQMNKVTLKPATYHTVNNKFPKSHVMKDKERQMTFTRLPPVRHKFDVNIEKLEEKSKSVERRTDQIKDFD